MFKDSRIDCTLHLKILSANRMAKNPVIKKYFSISKYEILCCLILTSDEHFLLLFNVLVDHNVTPNNWSIFTSKYEDKWLK